MQRGKTPESLKKGGANKTQSQVIQDNNLSQAQQQNIQKIKAQLGYNDSILSAGSQQQQQN